MKSKNFISIKCDYCEEIAIVNFQKIWIKFIIDKNGNYKKDTKFDGENFEQPINNENIHLCKKHLKKFLKGKI